MTPSQIRSAIRQAQSKRKQAIDRYNREVRRHNQNVKQAVNNYNNEVRRYNARVRANRQKIASELRRLQSSSTARYQIVKTSAIALNSYYERLDAGGSALENVHHGGEFLDLSERENANSLALSNALESEADESSIDPSELLRTEIDGMLQKLSSDLSNRWKGALFSLNPQNPDAARHFCTSAREVFVQILDMNAPDEKVLASYPDCDTTPSGCPTRKEKVRYLLGRCDLLTTEAVDFVDEDVKNVLALFRVFNDGTHGSSGKFGLNKLLSIKTRVEDGITYLFSICQNT
ncbi:hypothetical protein QWI17_09265 [Gilvimarinus sp. SDUM040013]|uniref:Predicted pPIWI-associating nuclease domain-containing protein n=1 Tax=Gilvimarinus gilvus TaxID=3058038 RepID=A0ABU4S3S2_9GAMM|nr:hypothetical protein [Gilvimarinus sp. SDUM040013]MDO3386024.1 hypothetical protein [Gilvimarinus sp. SDUM040013]MDX6850478.1 hypothetical protein [Gilvimarinus sp. SDUM040013]